MLSSSCSHSLLQRPSLTNPISKKLQFCVSSRRSSFSCTIRSRRLVESSSISSKNRLKTLCFSKDDFSSETQSKSDDVESLPPKQPVEHEVDKISKAKLEWKLSLLEVKDAVFSEIQRRWTVPWTAETILQIMLLWIASFWFIGSWVIPFAAHISGFSRESLTLRGRAFFSFVTDLTEGLAGIAILHRCLSRFRPLSSDWFKFTLKGHWIFDVVIGCLMFPLVNQLSHFNLNLVQRAPLNHLSISSVERSIRARDPVAMVLYALVVSVCAPVWEEIVFRGFLLPSLTKYMPVWCAIVVSSVAFALVHFNVGRILPLIFLGVVMGTIYARSRNLLPSMLLHSLWNGFVFLDLMK